MMAALAVSLSGALVLPPVTSARADDLKDKQDRVSRGIGAATAELEDSSAAQVRAVRRVVAARVQLAAAQRTLSATWGDLTAARLADARLQQALEQAQRDLVDAREDVEKGKREIVDQRDQIGRMAVENYQNGDPHLIGVVVVLKSQEPTDITRQQNAVDSLMSKEEATLERLHVMKVLLVAREAHVEEVKQEVALQREQAAQNLVERQRLEQAAAAQQADVARLLAGRQAAQGEATRARAADLRELGRLKAESVKIKKQILQRARRQRNLYRGRAEGYLSAPVAGRVTDGFGFRIHPIYGYYALHDGTDFAGGCGTPLKAVADGTVVSQYFQTAWGNRLLLDLGKINGKNVTVIYNHASEYAVGSGATVKRGQTIGAVGNTGWSTGCHLHFTVLVNGNPVDPMGWI